MGRAEDRQKERRTDEERETDRVRLGSLYYSEKSDSTLRREQQVSHSYHIKPQHCLTPADILTI